MEQKSPRVFNSEIIIDKENKWIFRGQEIIQENVLAYFKANLHEDELGIYIYNVHGELSEKGYLECYGFPLTIVNWFENEDGNLYLILDNDITYSLQDFRFYILEEEGFIFCKKESDQYTNIRISRPCYHFLSQYLEEENGEYRIEYNSIRKQVLAFPDSIYVGCPYPIS